MGRLVLPSGQTVDVDAEGKEFDILGTDATMSVDDLVWLAGYFRPWGPDSRQPGTGPHHTLVVRPNGLVVQAIAFPTAEEAIAKARELVDQTIGADVRLVVTGREIGHFEVRHTVEFVRG